MSERISIEAERGRRYRMGEPIVGTVGFKLGPGETIQALNVRIERTFLGQTKVLYGAELLGYLSGPGAYTEPFQIPFPQGAFAHSTGQLAVELWLVVSLEGLGEETRWTLLSAGALPAEFGSAALDDQPKSSAAPSYRLTVSAAFGAMFIAILAGGSLAVATLAAVVMGAAAQILPRLLSEEDDRLASARLELRRGSEADVVEAVLDAVTTTGEPIQEFELTLVGQERVPRPRDGLPTARQFVEVRAPLAQSHTTSATNQLTVRHPFTVPPNATPNFAAFGVGVEWLVRASFRVGSAPKVTLQAPLRLALPDESFLLGAEEVVASEAAEPAVHRSS